MKHLLIEFTCDQAIAFYEEVQRLGIENDVKAKQALLMEFVKNGNAVRAWSTERSKEQIVEDLKKNYGNVLDTTNHENPSQDNH